MPFAATVLTLYPEMFPGPLGMSLAGRALREGRWSLEAVQIRDFAIDKHRSVDDTPAGGGVGMVLRADVVAAALDSVAPGRPALAMTPRGRPLTQARVRDLAAGPGAVSESSHAAANAGTAASGSAQGARSLSREAQAAAGT